MLQWRICWSLFSGQAISNSQWRILNPVSAHLTTHLTKKKQSKFLPQIHRIRPIESNGFVIVDNVRSTGPKFVGRVRNRSATNQTNYSLPLLFSGLQNRRESNGQHANGLPCFANGDLLNRANCFVEGPPPYFWKPYCNTSSNCPNEPPPPYDYPSYHDGIK